MKRNPDRTPGTCEWFEDNLDFKKWNTSQSSSMLWISANPGCGKSVLAKYLAESVLPKGESRTVCYFFFKDDFSDQRGATGAICCILHQLFTERPDLFSEAIAQRLDAHRAHLASSFNEVWDALVAASLQKNAGEIICVLDAFDECADDERSMLSATLRSFYDPESEAKKESILKFFITSRPYDKVRQGFQPLSTPGLAVIHLRGESEIEVAKIASEINIYIEAKVQEMDDFLPEEKGVLLRALQQSPNQTYLWVYLAIEWIRDVRMHIVDAVDITSALPTTVNQAYEKILAKSVNPKEARKLLHIVVATTRPLTIWEMDSALSIGPSASSSARIDKPWGDHREDQCVKYIRNLCGLFVNIVDSKVYLLHQTAKEFLVAKPDPGSSTDSHESTALMWKSSFDPEESQDIICKICLWYLLPEDDTPDSGTLGGFFEYCAINWTLHFRNAQKTHDAAAIESAKQLLTASSTLFERWFRCYWAAMQVGKAPIFTSIMAASFFGLEQVLKLELASGDADINARDPIYLRSALSWAAENGFINVVRLLYEGPKLRFRQAITKPFARRGAKVDTRDVHQRTPLSYAAWNGHLPIVRGLIHAGADIHAQDDIGGTPISYAQCSSNMDLNHELLKNASAEEAQAMRNKLLLLAATTGQERVIKMLLETEADLETTGAERKTPLLAAIHGRHVAVARHLLNKGANTEAKDASGYLPLQLAVLLDLPSLFDMLLEKGADIEVIASGKCETPVLLLCGCIKTTRSLHMLRLLLDKGANIDARDKGSGTPLKNASKSGYEEEARLLLERNADIEATDYWGRTPLFFADVPIMKLLLKLGAQVDVVDSHGETPLYRNAKDGHFERVELLLQYGAQINLQTDNKGTALMGAALSGSAATVKLLLWHGAKVDLRNHSGQTALFVATESGDKETIKMLLSYGAKADDRDNKGFTALLYAAASGPRGTIQTLVSHGVRIDDRDNKGRTALSWVAYRGFDDAVECLLQHGADIEARDTSGWTPLCLAALYRCDATLDLLVRHGANLDIQDNSGRTPLSWAAECGNSHTVSVLVGHGAVVDIKDNRGRTPLAWANERRLLSIVQTLLNSGASAEGLDIRWTDSPL